ncbi:MAG TPA: NAD-dependent epimerase/dehydratase family protein [Nocardioides sp.]|uniref:NAD-dependent epimerase/dehydratase family protein n=1 Tax=Nocardioides sp. TaxID=35761 RepID=UPI002E3047E1|nr:NAD-dependent epimerase/dehydratase family protein [Nocardioides sp.]HEX5089867.1 NAD-dependent epimerase/dehydratase family protein [Nocardioides sp.]
MTLPAGGDRLRRTCVVGGAGFIGSHFVARLLSDPETEQVTVYDNFSSGRDWHLEPVADDPRLSVVRADVGDLATLTETFRGHASAIHLASNPDIAAAVANPAIDFDQGTLLTHHVAEAARMAELELVLYASGSGVYGDLGEVEAAEDHGPMIPTSTYGASKLAGEAILAAYAAMFDFTVRAFRFGNVVGPHQTHGVGFDFVRRLLEDPTRLRILGDGRQSKSYIYVDDVIDAVLTAGALADTPFDAFNVATGDYVTVTEIAELAMAVLGLEPGTTIFDYTGGDRGWKGDVPVVRINTDKIRSLGWSNQRTGPQALRDSMSSMADDARAGLLTT